MAGSIAPDAAFNVTGAALQDAIQRARTGQGGTYETGFNDNSFTIDVETRQAAREYRPFKDIVAVSPNVPILFITAENDELINNANNAVAASEALNAQGNTVNLIEIPGITHFEVYRGEPFATGAAAASDWFNAHL